SALAYPAFTIVLAVVIYILFASFVVQPFRIIVEEFQLTLPVNTTVLFWVSSTGLGWFVSLLGVLGLVLVALRLIGGRAAWSWMMAQLPLVGGAWQCTGAAEMLRGLSLLTEHRIPLPDALRLAGGGITDAYVGQLCRDLATRVEQGSPLFMAILEQRTLPLSIVPIVRWGEQHGLLGEGLKSAAEMLEGRLRMRSLILIQVIPPLALLVVGVLILSLVGIITSTLFSLLQGLI
ncbi:MAG: type II secretion system F family protein, partial [Pirellulaceae bacterium]